MLETIGVVAVIIQNSPSPVYLFGGDLDRGIYIFTGRIANSADPRLLVVLRKNLTQSPWHSQPLPEHCYCIWYGGFRAQLEHLDIVMSLGTPLVMSLSAPLVQHQVPIGLLYLRQLNDRQKFNFTQHGGAVMRIGHFLSI